MGSCVGGGGFVGVAPSRRCLRAKRTLTLSEIGLPQPQPTETTASQVTVTALARGASDATPYSYCASGHCL